MIEYSILITIVAATLLVSVAAVAMWTEGQLTRFTPLPPAALQRHFATATAKHPRHTASAGSADPTQPAMAVDCSLAAGETARMGRRRNGNGNSGQRQ